MVEFMTPALPSLDGTHALNPVDGALARCRACGFIGGGIVSLSRNTRR